MRISDWSSDVCSSDLLVQTDLLALDLACVAGHEARRAQLALERLVVHDQRAGDAQADRTGLAGGAAAAGGDEDVEALRVLGPPARLAHDHDPGLRAEAPAEPPHVAADLVRAAPQEPGRVA